MALNAKPDRPNSGCCLALISTVPKIRYGASGRKPQFEIPVEMNMIPLDSA